MRWGQRGRGLAPLGLVAGLALGGCLGFGGDEPPVVEPAPAPTAARTDAPDSDADRPSPTPASPKPAVPQSEQAGAIDGGADDPALRPSAEWSMITRRRSADGALVEFVPRGQTATTWTKMASVTRAVLGEPASAAKVRRYLFQPYRERCADISVEVLAQNPPDGGDLMDEAVLVCEGFDRDGLPESVNARRHEMLYVEVRATRTGYETFQFTWHHDSIPAREYRRSALFEGEARAWRTGMEAALRQMTAPQS